MKLKNIAALIALAAVAGWKMGIEPRWVQFQAMQRLHAFEIEQCAAAIDQIQWARLKESPPTSIEEAQQLLGEGCRGELGALAYRFEQYILELAQSQEGLEMEWSDATE